MNFVIQFNTFFKCKNLISKSEHVVISVIPVLVSQKLMKKWKFIFIITSWRFSALHYHFYVTRGLLRYTTMKEARFVTLPRDHVPQATRPAPCPSNWVTGCCSRTWHCCSSRSVNAWSRDRGVCNRQNVRQAIEKPAIASNAIVVQASS